MLDRIHMFIRFRKEHVQLIGKVDSPTLVVDLESLGVRMRSSGGLIKREEGGYDVEDLSHAWESLPSSYTPMAFKVFHQSLGKRLDPGVELKASPAKLLQGHNVFGPTSIRKGAEVMIKWLAGSYPDLWAKLDVLSIEVYALDCTFSARMPNEQTALQVIQFMRGVSNGQGLPLSLRQRLLRQLEGLRLYSSDYTAPVFAVYAGSQVGWQAHQLHSALWTRKRHLPA